MLKVIREKTTVECVALTPVKEATKPWNSKLGGLPYMPKGFAYPFEEIGNDTATEAQVPAMNPATPTGPFAGLDGSAPGVPPVESANTESAPRTDTPTAEAEPEMAAEHVKLPLRFLGQLNFSEMPPLEGFPRQGILQFYISGQDTYGLNFENPVEQNGFRVIYHEEVVEDEVALLTTLPGDMVDQQEGFPIDGELRLTFEKTTMPMGCGDYRFDKILLDAYNQAHPGNTVPSLDRLPEDCLDEVYDQLDMGGHRVGGYPMFTQIDPREYREDLKGHTVLLFQLDSDEGEDYSILWGDSGVCNFFIHPDDLAKRDFSKVVYNWDCY